MASRSWRLTSTTRRLARGRGHVEHSTERAVARGKLAAGERQALLSRIEFGTDLGALADADLVIEAVPEQLDLKRAIFEQLDGICRPEPSSPPTPRPCRSPRSRWQPAGPGKVVGMHFFNPAPVMKLVEIVRTVVTEQDVVDDVEAFAQKLGKVDVTIGDRAGFIANALLFGYLNHAASLLRGALCEP